MIKRLKPETNTAVVLKYKSPGISVVLPIPAL